MLDRLMNEPLLGNARDEDTYWANNPNGSEPLILSQDVKVERGLLPNTSCGDKQRETAPPQSATQLSCSEVLGGDQLCHNLFYQVLSTFERGNGGRVNSRNNPRATRDLKAVENKQKPEIVVGSSSFKDLLMKSDIFIDKTVMVKEFLEESGKVIVITRPQRWGKSLNMDMLRRFFEIEVDRYGDRLPEGAGLNSKLFAGGTVHMGLANGHSKTLRKLGMSQYSRTMAEHQGQSPVLLVQFSHAAGKNAELTELAIRSEIMLLFARHSYLEPYTTEDTRKQFLRYSTGNLEVEDLVDSLRFLTQLLSERFGKKVYLFVDDYDMPISNAYLEFRHKPEDLARVLGVMRRILTRALEGNVYLEKGLLTGVLSIANFLELSDSREYTLLDQPFAKWYGFTPAEVDGLLRQLSLPATVAGGIKRFYRGYSFGGQLVYNPWSVMSCLQSGGVLDDHWLEGVRMRHVDDCCFTADMQDALHRLIAGGNISSPIDRHMNLADLNSTKGVFSLLLFSGYLNSIARNHSTDIYKLSIPNEEVIHIFERGILNWVSAQLHTNPLSYIRLVSLLPVGKIEQFKMELHELFLKAAGLHSGKPRAECMHTSFMIALLFVLKWDYTVASERESGTVVVLVPKELSDFDNVIVIDYIICKSCSDLESVAETRLCQLTDNQYSDKFRVFDHMKNIITMVLAFCDAIVATKYQIGPIKLEDRRISPKLCKTSGSCTC